MIIEQNGNREDKPLCHVAMVAKFLDLNTTVFPQIWQEKTKKTDMCDFPLHDCTATQESNKTVTKQDTGTTQQQKRSDKPFWGTWTRVKNAVRMRAFHASGANLPVEIIRDTKTN